MTITIETIDGRTYRVTRSDGGAIVTQASCDPPPAQPVTLTKFGYRSLLTLDERVAIDNVADSALTADQKAVVKTLSYDFQIADVITLSDPATIAGTNALESYGLLAAGRAAQILANQPPA